MIPRRSDRSAQFAMMISSIFLMLICTFWTIFDLLQILIDFVFFLHEDPSVVQVPLPKFDHLTCLEIGCNVAWNSLLDFLESSPQLEKLSFAGLPLQEEVEENQTTYSWYPPENVPSCSLFHLKVIYIWWFKGEIDELKMIEYFLKDSKVLKRLLIHPCIDTKSSGINIIAEMLPRGSEKCQVLFF
ncbi:putative F-box/FBD/LRR-repeat protein At3g49030 [Cornus florida]|uniref:putative F-box/FBD/LRR-repeat protein At3g49030 n=1 Tax=Cornus florida TaxID=4283 RepID=UPI00289DD48A|nr:putative F-box/FBD/LRR-repeat protein At3g49030 [Cornus florida]